MESLKQNQLSVDDGVGYTYYTSPSTENLPTLLLLHGCPDTAQLWSDLIATYLLPAGYGILTPDLIGYGATDKPSDLAHYSLAAVCKQLLSILDHEHLDTVIVLGHDFGAALASKMYSYHAERVAGLIILGTSFLPPSPYPFDFQQVKAMQEQYQGYCSSWYFSLFTSDEGAAKIEAHLDRMFTLLHGGGARMKDVLCVEGGIERWLEDSTSTDAEVLQYAQDPHFRKTWIDRLELPSSFSPLKKYRSRLPPIARKVRVCVRRSHS